VFRQRLLPRALIMLLCSLVVTTQGSIVAQTNQAKATESESIEKRLNLSGLNSRPLSAESPARSNSGISLPHYARSFGSLHGSFKEKDLVAGNVVPLPSKQSSLKTSRISSPNLNLGENREFGFTDLPKSKLSPQNANLSSVNKAYSR